MTTISPTCTSCGNNIGHFSSAVMYLHNTELQREYEKTGFLKNDGNIQENLEPYKYLVRFMPSYRLCCYTQVMGQMMGQINY